MRLAEAASLGLGLEAEPLRGGQALVELRDLFETLPLELLQVLLVPLLLFTCAANGTLPPLADFLVSLAQLCQLASLGVALLLKRRNRSREFPDPLVQRQVLVGLYEEPERPANAVDYIKRYLGAPAGVDVEALKAELSRLKKENTDLRDKIEAAQEDE